MGFRHDMIGKKRTGSVSTGLATADEPGQTVAASRALEDPQDALYG